MYEIERAIPTPQVVIIVQRRARRQVFRDGPPLTTGGEKADSTGRRNTLCMAHSEEFVESFRRCFPAEGFSRPGVECKGHGLKVIGIVCAEIGALWKVLA